MFWKVVGGIAIFIMVVVLALGMVATAGLAVAGVAIDSALENLEFSTVQVTDAGGRTETYSVNELLSGTERLEVYGDIGEQVTIDLALPQITVQEGGKDAATVVINGDDAPSVVIDGKSGIEIGATEPQIRIDGRDINSSNNFDGGFLGRFIVGIFKGLFNLVLVGMIVVGVWLLVRSQRSKNVEKTPDAAA
ncbi:MAG: hypothetical protein R3293_08755 [Candidatus Promineifilaceae bacterium]|nr:hypothetical protein [Candidatus Promineifilaceae bacterium]